MFYYPPPRQFYSIGKLNFIEKYDAIRFYKIADIISIIRDVWHRFIKHDGRRILHIEKGWKKMCWHWPLTMEKFVHRVEQKRGMLCKLIVVCKCKCEWQKELIDISIKQLIQCRTAINLIRSIPKNDKILQCARASDNSVVRNWKKKGLYKYCLPIISSANEGCVLYSWRFQKELQKGYGIVKFPNKDRLGRINWVGEKRILEFCGLKVRFGSSANARLPNAKIKESSLLKKLSGWCVVDWRLGVGKRLGKIALVHGIKVVEKVVLQLGERLEHWLLLTSFSGVSKPLAIPAE